MKKIDKNLVGQKMGFLNIIDIDRRNSKLYCKCKCDCGNIVDIYKGNVTSGHTISCGCKKNRLLLEERQGQLIGKKFGNLLVQKEYIKDNRISYCECKCDCGKNKTVKTYLLKQNKITHCDNCLLQYDYLKGKKYGELEILDVERKQNNLYCKCKCKCGNVVYVLKRDILNGRISNCGCSFDKQKYFSIIGKKYGKLRVLDVEKEKSVIYYLCKCDCGNTIRVNGRTLKNKENPPHCGCEYVGKRYNKLVVIDVIRLDKKVFLKCKCDCGNITLVEYWNLKTGHTSSCGCIVKNNEYKDIIGKRFGKLIVIKELDNKMDKNGHRHFICKCDCGNEIEVLGHNLLANQTQSCGCRKIVRRLQSKTPITNKSGVKGVFFDKRNKKWIASLGINYNRYKIYEKTFGEAITERKKLEKEYHLPIIQKYQ